MNVGSRMFNKLSFKIGLLFFVFILVIESFLFFILYINLANDRIDEVMDSLLARGNTHSDVLEDHFDQSTLDHVVIMESESEFSVVITDETGKIITSSDSTEEAMIDIINHSDANSDIPSEGKIVEDNWNDEQYIATDSPITVNGQHEGHVFMFAESNYVKRTVDQLSSQFFITGLITVGLTIFTIFLLSRFIARPLIQMKKATEQLSKGKNHVVLNTERKDELGDLATSVTKLAADLKKLKIERNEFLASIAHELRTPLTYIQGYADIINREGTTDAEKAEYTQIIREETEELTLLVKHLFELAKMDEHNFKVSPEWLNLAQILQQIIERIEPVLAEKKIKFHVDCPDDLHVFVDQERIQQVFMNILDNAQKHADEDSTIEVLVSQTAKYIIIKIIDQGDGIPESDLPYIFERLYRVEKSRSRQSGGAGLGLSITKEIVEAHGGSIEMESEKNKGTSVIIKLLAGEYTDEEGTNR